MVLDTSQEIISIETEMPILLSKICKNFNRDYGDFLKPYNLSKLHAFYLIILLKNPQGIKLKQITDELGCDKANTSRAVTELIERGIISKTSNNDKERKYDIKLTEQGYAVACDFAKLVSNNTSQVLSVLNQEELVSLRNIISKLTNYYSGGEDDSN
ncbi:MAG: MarR family transcriptional regulator [Clostridiales bacterium]|nr:MarR family transcriptional regulator [Clostridiales bacterium]